MTWLARITRSVVPVAACVAVLWATVTPAIAHIGRPAPRPPSSSASSSLSGSKGFIGRTAWLQEGFDPGHANDNPYDSAINTSNISHLAQRWTAGDADGSFSLVSDGGTVFSQDGMGYFYALNAASGAVEWSFRAPVSADISAAAVAGKYVYVTDDENLYAFKAAGCGASTCSPVWTASRAATATAPVVSADVVYVSTNNGSNLSAFNASNGSLLWNTSSINTGFVGPPAVEAGMVYLPSFSNGTIYVLDASSGKLLWTASAGTSVSAAAVDDGVLFATSIDGHLYAFSAGGCGSAMCTYLWRAAVTGAGQEAPAIASGLVFVESTANNLHAFAVGGCGQPSCSEVWIGSGPSGGVGGAPVVAGGLVYAPFGGGLYVYRLAGCGAPTCVPLWTYSAFGSTSSAIVDNGVLYLTDGFPQQYHPSIAALAIPGMPGVMP